MASPRKVRREVVLGSTLISTVSWPRAAWPVSHERWPGGRPGTQQLGASDDTFRRFFVSRVVFGSCPGRRWFIFRAQTVTFGTHRDHRQLVETFDQRSSRRRTIMIEAARLSQERGVARPLAQPRERGSTTCWPRLTLAEKVGQLGSRWVLNDMSATGEPGEPDDPASDGPDQAEVMQRRADAGRLRGLRHPRARGRGGPRARAPDPGLRQPAAHARGGRRRGRPPAARRHRALATGHPRDRARGVPDRLHRLRRDRLPGGDRVGRHLRPRPRRGDGGRHRS